MKKISLLIAGAFALAGVIMAHSASMTVNKSHVNGVNPSFAWSETTFNFGQIKMGAPVTHEFTFTNNGKEPLIITSVKASCGCTVASYSTDPIPAGGKGFVKATYNAAKGGSFTKTVTVNANTEEGTILLTIQGEVLEKEGTME